MATEKVQIKIIRAISFFGLVVFICDRFFKQLAWLDKIAWQKNSGLVFSLNLPTHLFLYFYILIFLILLIIVWNFINACQKKNWWLATGLWLILLGAASNLIDRLKFSAVIDYLNFGFFYNNLADILICLGILLVILNLWLRKK